MHFQIKLWVFLQWKQRKQKLCSMVQLTLYLQHTFMYWRPYSDKDRLVLIDLSLTVKAATLIFISGRGSAISSAKEGNQVLSIIW